MNEEKKDSEGDDERISDTDQRNMIKLGQRHKTRRSETRMDKKQKYTSRSLNVLLDGLFQG